MFKDPIHFEKDYLEQHWNEETETIVTSFLDVLSSIEPFTNEQIEISVKEFLTNNSIPMKKFVHPLRVAITGKKIGADLYSTIQLLGKNAVVRRLKSILELRNQMTEFVTEGIDPKTGETIEVTMVELPITPLEIHN
jgi:glutamyl/glutaminyl-tRNA synthetase